LITEGVEAGADIVLSLNSINMGIAGPIVARTGTAAVIILMRAIVWKALSEI